MDGVFMSEKELSTYRHEMNFIEGRLNITELSMMIGKLYRQAQIIIKKIKEKGPLGAVHGNQGRAPANKSIGQIRGQIHIRPFYIPFLLSHQLVIY
jgi:hypothetical protein